MSEVKTVEIGEGGALVADFGGRAVRIPADVLKAVINAPAGMCPGLQQAAEAADRGALNLDGWR